MESGLFISTPVCSLSVGQVMSLFNASEGSNPNRPTTPNIVSHPRSGEHYNNY